MLHQLTAPLATPLYAPETSHVTFGEASVTRAAESPKSPRHTFKETVRVAMVAHKSRKEAIDAAEEAAADPQPTQPTQPTLSALPDGVALEITEVKQEVAAVRQDVREIKNQLKELTEAIRDQRGSSLRASPTTGSATGAGHLNSDSPPCSPLARDSSMQRFTALAMPAKKGGSTPATPEEQGVGLCT